MIAVDRKGYIDFYKNHEKFNIVAFTEVLLKKYFVFDNKYIQPDRLIKIVGILITYSSSYNFEIIKLETF